MKFPKCWHHLAKMPRKDLYLLARPSDKTDLRSHIFYDLRYERIASADRAVSPSYPLSLSRVDGRRESGNTGER